MLTKLFKHDPWMLVGKNKFSIKKKKKKSITKHGTVVKARSPMLKSVVQI